jgi:hypothetical protein
MQSNARRAQLAVGVVRACPARLDMDRRDVAIGTVRQRGGCNEQQLRHRHHGGGDAHRSAEPEER